MASGGPDEGQTGGSPAEPSLNTGEDAQEAPSALPVTEQNEDIVKVCQFFLMGKCHFGHKCRSSHSDPSLDDSGAVSPDPDEKQDVEKMERHKKKKGGGNKGAKPKYDEGKEMNKKPRMRTADDVISRILWDSSVDSSGFVVGYVDRFLGVLERPFCEFNWDINPCDCDFSSELALPRHRIQYFSYRGHRVWDRHTRTDRVFGSTGQSLAPPFGGVGEVKEEVNQDDQAQQDHFETKGEQPAAVRGQGEGEKEVFTHIKKTHLEEEELNEMIHGCNSTHLGGNDSQAQEESCGTCVAKESTNRQTLTEQNTSFQEEEIDVKNEGEEESFPEWEESCDGNENTRMSQDPLGPLDQREEMCVGRPLKKQPTHFISFRANTPAVLSCFQQLKDEITALLPSSAPYWQTASRLHVTLCLLVLRCPAEVEAAGEILRRFAYLDRNPPIAVTFPVKLKHFNGKVLYLSPQPQLPLQQLNSGLQEAYRNEGWLHRSSYNPRYHLTLAKVERTVEERTFQAVGDLKVGKGLNFGRLPVNTLHLCVVRGPGFDGFYETLYTVALR
ncbi:leukocyte receptor cluster member 9 [Cololabis saira]|uniref:leukocyte receptor cluster member 9 n=1 Tax=Cololabis saira TaxID=129043 RepID=UPI002AD1D245|nr:leukocyte receptor cluster member 9 [Cololabis saira]XP_061572965.1 leukocyte receptor cluster member 9 [Cololabis saira]